MSNTAIHEVAVTLHDANNEGTRSPYWLILDPKQMMRVDVHFLSSMITGPFFSREDAENYLHGRSYNFSSRARVFCHSGYASYKYDELCKEVRTEN